MKFTTILALGFTMCPGAFTAPTAKLQLDPGAEYSVSQATPGLQARTPAGLEKRILPVVTIGFLGNTAASLVTRVAIRVAADALADKLNWTKTREQFTKKTTAEMWANNPDFQKYPAAVCYNQGYALDRPEGITGLVSAKVTLGPLNTDYDCMFMEAPNTFRSNGDGGYINKSYSYDQNRCSFDQTTGSLTCT